MNSTSIKRKLAVAFDTLGINAAGFALQKLLFSPFIRVVNYHDIPSENKANFESHLKYYSDKYINVDEKTLRSFLNDETWPHPKPGLIISFDDGLTSHIEAAKPLLEKYGFTGWFFVPAERFNTKIPIAENALTAEQVKEIGKLHIVGSHTMTHLRLGADVKDDVMNFETLDAKRLMEKALGHEVKIFCWVGGEEFAYSKKAAEKIKQGYDLSFMTNAAIVRPGTNPLQLQRTNIESDNPLPLVKFQLAGFLDLLYFPKRRRVNRLTQ